MKNVTDEKLAAASLTTRPLPSRGSGGLPYLEPHRVHVDTWLRPGTGEAIDDYCGQGIAFIS